MTAQQLGYKAPLFYQLGGAVIQGLKGEQHAPPRVLCSAKCTVAVHFGLCV